MNDRTATVDLRKPFIEAAIEGWPGGRPTEFLPYAMMVQLDELISWLHVDVDSPPKSIDQFQQLLDASYDKPTESYLRDYGTFKKRYSDQICGLRSALAANGEPPLQKAERLEELERERQLQLADANRARVEREKREQEEREARQRATELEADRLASYVPDDEDEEILREAIDADGRPLAFRRFALASLLDEGFLDRHLDDASRRIVAITCEEGDYPRLPMALDELESLYFSGSNLSSLLTGDAPTTDWVVPGRIAHKDRWVLTGDSGVGKSHFGLQVCWDAARGVNPLTGEQTGLRPRTLFVNLELNDSDLLAMCHKLGAADEPGVTYRTGHYAAGVDVMDDDDAMLRFLKQEVEEFQPDLIWLAGVYKMTTEDLGHKVEPMRRIHALVDHWRNELPSKPAVMLEAQKGHNEHRPKGGKEWMYWPEFGIHLTKTGVVSKWTHRNDQRYVPDELKRMNGRWMVPPDLARLCFDIVSTEGSMSNQKLGERLGVSKHTIGRSFSADDKDRAIEASLDGQGE